jgi:hypothetical protein
MIEFQSIAWAIALGCFALLAAQFVVMGDGDEQSLSWADITGSGLFVVLILLRAPILFHFDRVWAEAGTLYFAYAYEHGPWIALVRQVSNYFDLTENLASATAAVVGPRFWPYVDTLFGYAPMLGFPLMLKGLRFSRRQRVGVMLAVSALVYSILSGETFGTSLHVKGWGAVYVFLTILSLSLWHNLRLTHKLVLLVAPFTGPPAAFIIIIYAILLAALLKIQNARVLAWAVPGLVIQILCALLPGGDTGFVARPFNLTSILTSADLLVVKGFASLFMPNLFFNKVPSINELTFANLVIGSLTLCVVVVFTIFKSHRALLLLVALILIHFYATVTLSLGGAVMIYAQFGFRYFFPTLCMLFVLGLVLASSMRRISRTAASLLMCLIVLQDHPAVKGFDELFFNPHQPPWDQQVAEFNKGARKEILIYPSGWRLSLPE